MGSVNLCIFDDSVLCCDGGSGSDDKTEAWPGVCLGQNGRLQIQVDSSSASSFSHCRLQILRKLSGIAISYHAPCLNYNLRIALRYPTRQINRNRSDSKPQ